MCHSNAKTPSFGERARGKQQNHLNTKRFGGGVRCLPERNELGQSLTAKGKHSLKGKKGKERPRNFTGTQVIKKGGKCPRRIKHGKKRRETAVEKA